MTPKEALNILIQLARAAGVNADVGDKRDEAVSILQKLVDDASEKE